LEAEREALAFGHLVSSSPIGQVLLRCTPDGPIIEAMNQACQRILGSGDPHAGRPLADLARPGLDIDALLAMVPVDATVDTIEFAGARGRIHQATLRRVDDRSCSIDFLDVTGRVEANARLHAQARQDDLTGLPNRRSFLETLEQRLDSVDSDCALRPGAVVILDLDDFKDINDSLGHEVGDQLLQRVGRTIVDHAAPDDVVARLGGDEFAMILAGTDEARALELTRALVEAINEPVIVGDLRLRVRASAGMAPVDDGAGSSGVSAAELVRCADVAMYVAKEHGTGVERYDPIGDHLDRERQELVSQLDEAISQEQLVLHHQPLFDVTTGRLIGTEALARWEHPTLGLVPPDEFIGLAEVSGKMKHLTRWVIRRALDDLIALGDAAADLEVSVNLSVRNLYEVDLVDWVAMTLRNLGIDPRRLVVEITESTVMDDQISAIEVIQGLRDLGVRTWIDDFGTGHSSFSRLRTLPVDGVKIDRSFVSGSLTSASDRIVLRSMVELVSSLGLHTVAEGVEDSSTMDLLATFGCATAQGFALGRPMTFTDLRCLVRDRDLVSEFATTN
jgi:diguanylate cyclase (GGDEF)-like protein